MAKVKKIAKKRVVKKPPPVLSWRDKVEIKLLVAKARLNSFWHSLKVAVRGY